MNRKLALIVVAIILPGGLIALFGAMLFKALTQTERGRRVVDLAKRRVPALQSFGASMMGEQAA
ncbi:MAG TPA: hypothetical protein VEP66_10510 [Myxococcales bacterium]|nr:hypothetical protein [Myxococcales bacterium]